MSQTQTLNLTCSGRTGPRCSCACRDLTQVGQSLKLHMHVPAELGSAALASAETLSWWSLRHHLYWHEHHVYFEDCTGSAVLASKYCSLSRVNTKTSHNLRRLLLQLSWVVPKGLFTFLESLYKEVAKTTSGALVYRFERQTAWKNIFLPSTWNVRFYRRNLQISALFKNKKCHILWKVSWRRYQSTVGDVSMLW